MSYNSAFSAKYGTNCLFNLVLCTVMTLLIIGAKELCNMFNGPIERLHYAMGCSWPPKILISHKVNIMTGLQQLLSLDAAYSRDVTVRRLSTVRLML